MSNTMRAIEIIEPGAPEVLAMTEHHVPAPGQGEVLIYVSAFRIHRPDVFQCRGNFPVPPGVTDIPPSRWQAILSRAI